LSWVTKNPRLALIAFDFSEGANVGLAVLAARRHYLVIEENKESTHSVLTG
jgi:hypothetical protein